MLYVYLSFPLRPPRPSTPMHPLTGVYHRVQPSTNGRQSVETECYHWPMCHYCAPAVRQLHNSLAGAVGIRATTHTRFFIFYVGYCSPIRSSFIKTDSTSGSNAPQSKEYRSGPRYHRRCNRARISRSEVTIRIGFSMVRPLTETRDLLVFRLKMKHALLRACMHTSCAHRALLWWIMNVLP